MVVVAVVVVVVVVVVHQGGEVAQVLPLVEQVALRRLRRWR